MESNLGSTLSIQSLSGYILWIWSSSHLPWVCMLLLHLAQILKLRVHGSPYQLALQPQQPARSCYPRKFSATAENIFAHSDTRSNSTCAARSDPASAASTRPWREEADRCELQETTRVRPCRASLASSGTPARNDRPAWVWTSASHTGHWYHRRAPEIFSLGLAARSCRHRIPCSRSNARTISARAATICLQASEIGRSCERCIRWSGSSRGP